MIRSVARPALVVVLLMVVGGAAAILAQRGFGRGSMFQPQVAHGEASYDGKFAFVRVSYSTGMGRRGAPPWSHDYPYGEQKLMQIMQSTTLLSPHVFESRILNLDDPEIFRYPVIYMAEPGYWWMTPEEAESFRDYLLKGGFIIFDDLANSRGGWDNFAAAFRMAMPEAEFIDLTAEHPIFHAFFSIPSLEVVPQAYDAGPPIFRAVFEDNDPTKRMLAMINFNTDISEYWEYSGTGYRAVSETNEAFKLGVNYIIYGLTH